MKRIHTIIIGAGQAGLALSRCLTDRGVDHVLLERGRVAQRWTERWDSLRLLSPNWMTRLPGWGYRGDDPDGFMRRDEVVTFLRDYAQSFSAPVEEQTSVLEVSRCGSGWRVVTDRGAWRSTNVVIATGYCHAPQLPPFARDLPASITSLSSLEYRNERQLPQGTVLVVGASSSGVQLARELRRSGRQVVLAAGRHTRVPRRYRGRDIHYWLDRIGLMSRPLSDMRDAEGARREPSLQLIGSDSSEDIDLQQLSRAGIVLAGRLTGFDGGEAHFADDLGRSIADADRQMRRILSRIDRHIAAHGADARFPAEPAPRPVRPASVVRHVPLQRIDGVVWATGYRRDYSWLRAPVLDAQGEILHTRGRTPARGLYVLGLQFMTRRNSSLIDGVGRDAAEIAGEIARTLIARREAA